MRILSPLPRAGVEQSMCRISAATRIAKLHRRTDIREYPTTAVFVSFFLICLLTRPASLWATIDFPHAALSL